jgi:hypothetical protein
MGKEILLNRMKGEEGVALLKRLAPVPGGQPWVALNIVLKRFLWYSQSLLDRGM